MDTKARHLLAEYHGCDRDLLEDVEGVRALLEAAARAAGATVVQSVFHRFSPQGVTGVVVLEESHLSVHTWPETGYAAADLYTCGDCRPEAAHEVLFAGLCAARAEVMQVARGLPGARGMRIEQHFGQTASEAAPAATTVAPRGGDS